MRARTRLVVLSSFQRWFLLNFIGYTLLFLGIFAAGILLYFKFVANELIEVGGLLSSTFLSLVEKHLAWGLWMILSLVAILLGLAGYQALFFSRRIAGPIFALSRHLDRCLDTKAIEHLKLRDNDLFVEVAEKFNRLADQVNSRKQ